MRILIILFVAKSVCQTNVSLSLTCSKVLSGLINLAELPRMLSLIHLYEGSLKWL